MANNNNNKISSSNNDNDDSNGARQKKLRAEMAGTDLDLIKREALYKIQREQERMRMKVNEIVDQMLDLIVKYVQEN